MSRRSIKAALVEFANGMVLSVCENGSLFIVEKDVLYRASPTGERVPMGRLDFSRLSSFHVLGDRLVLMSSWRRHREVRLMSDPSVTVEEGPCPAQSVGIDGCVINVLNEGLDYWISSVDASRDLARRDYESVPWIAGAPIDASESSDPPEGFGALFVKASRHVASRNTCIIQCISPRSLELIWERDFDKYYLTNRFREPILTGNSVIAVVGWNERTQRDAEIVSLRRTDGATIWSRIFQDHPSTCELVRDRLYIEEGGRLWVLDAASGETIVTRTIGFSFQAPTLVWTEGTRILVFSGPRARAFSLDGKEVLEDWELTRPYEFTLEPPVLVGDSFWMRAAADSGKRLLNTSTALIRFERANADTSSMTGRTTTICPEPWPVGVHVYSIQTNKETKYHVSVTGDSADDVVRYGYIVLRWVAQARGAMLFNDYRFEKTFRGHILFSWTVPNDDNSAIRTMVEELQQELKEAPQPVTDIRFDVVPMPDEPPGREEPIGALVTPMMSIDLGDIEKVPQAIYRWCSEVMTQWIPNDTSIAVPATSLDVAETFLKKAARRSPPGCVPVLRDHAQRLRAERRSPSVGTDPAGYRRSISIGAVAAYAEVGKRFYASEDRAYWFSTMSKLARAICKQAPQNDEAVLQVYRAVDELAEVGRQEFEARKAAGEFSCVPPWEVRR